MKKFSDLYESHVQVVLVVAGRGVRTPKLPRPAPCLGDITIDAPLHKYWGDMSPCPIGIDAPAYRRPTVYFYTVVSARLIIYLLIYFTCVYACVRCVNLYTQGPSASCVACIACVAEIQ